MSEAQESTTADMEGNVSDVQPELSQHLSPAHLEMLRRGSAISDDVIAARGYRTVTDPVALAALGFSPAQCRVPGLLLPLWAPGVDDAPAFYVYRPDAPRSFDEKHKGPLPDGTYPQRVVKYEVPKGSSMRLDCPPPCHAAVGDPDVPLWITEGQKKADALASQGLCALALLGVWNWRGRNGLGGLTALADWESVALRGRDVRIVFDSDVMRKPEVGQALRRLRAFLANRGAAVAAVYLPPPPPGAGAKCGVDDYLAAGHSLADLQRLVEAPRPLPTPPAPVVELLDAEPPVLRRPLALIDGRSYAAVWLHVKVTRSADLNKAGELVRFDPPRVTLERRLFVVRDDGRVFGEGGDALLDELGLEVHLPEIPPPDKLWSARGVTAYRRRYRPDPIDIFLRVSAVVDRFIDFNRSLGDQEAMANMVACYILAGWFLDAFNVIGNLWPNGDRGSGKTQLLNVVAEMGYLGQVLLAGGSYASLRDMADYGATLAFDDAENLSDPARTDPDKRALLLAGNRRGACVAVKELGGDRAWRTRYVNTFTPRLFSATRLPDPILASRTIVVPLIRTPDRRRANADPLEAGLWPCNRRELLDDLWAMALEHLPELPAYEARVAATSPLVGRDLEPWKAILAVALWLDDRGVCGLAAQMEALAANYQSERPGLETADLTALVIQALVRCAAEHVPSRGDVGDRNDGGDVKEEISRALILTTSQVTRAARTLAQEQESDLDTETLTGRRIGRVLRKMRWRSERTKSARGWAVNLAELHRWTRAYGVEWPEQLHAIQGAPYPTNVTSVISVTNVTAPEAQDASREDDGELPSSEGDREVFFL
jgi:hypothetical protein